MCNRNIQLVRTTAFRRKKKKSSSFKIRFFYSLLWDHFEINHVYCVDNWSSFDATRKSFLIILPQTER